MNKKSLKCVGLNCRNMHDEIRNIVFFDGVCGVCNSLVDWMLKLDKKGKLYFCSLQSEKALSLLGEERVKNLDTLYFIANGNLYERSTAALHILTKLGFFYSFLAKMLFIVPIFLRDGIYNWVSRNRYSWFGKREECRIPSKEELERFVV